MSKGLVVFIKTNMLGSEVKEFYPWDKLGITEQEFEAMLRETQEKFAWSIVSENLDWGFYKGEENE